MPAGAGDERPMGMNASLHSIFSTRPSSLSGGWRYRTNALMIGCLAAAAILSGCVAGRSDVPNPAWPTAVATSEIRQFEGVFRNESLLAATGATHRRGSSLFAFLGGTRRIAPGPGERVEIRISPEGTLRVRLLDSQHHEISAVSLERKKGFSFAAGRLQLQGRRSGGRADAGNLGVGVSYRHSELQLSAAGSLLGREAQGSAGLLFYFVPLATSSEQAMQWLRLDGHCRTTSLSSPRVSSNSRGRSQSPCR